MYHITWLFCPALLTSTIILLLRNLDLISNSFATKEHHQEGMSMSFIQMIHYQPEYSISKKL